MQLIIFITNVIVSMFSINASSNTNESTNYTPKLNTNEQGISRDISYISVDNLLITAFELPFDPKDHEKFSKIEAFSLLQIDKIFPIIDESKILRADEKLEVLAEIFSFYAMEVLLFFKYHYDIFAILNNLESLNIQAIQEHPKKGYIDGVLLIIQSNYIFHYLYYKKDFFLYIENFIDIITEGVNKNKPLLHFMSIIHDVYTTRVNKVLQTADYDKDVIVNEVTFHPKKLINDFNTVRDLHVLQIYSISLLIFDLKITDKNDMIAIFRPWFLSYINTGSDINTKNFRVTQIMQLGQKVKSGFQCLFNEIKTIKNGDINELYDYLIENGKHLETIVLNVVNLIFTQAEIEDD